MKKLSDYLYYEEKDPDLKIYCGDCLEIMPLLEKVDLVLTDPPYGIDYGGLLKGKGNGRGGGRQERMEKLRLPRMGQREAANASF